jgi:hypothetical protein
MVPVVCASCKKEVAKRPRHEIIDGHMCIKYRETCLNPNCENYRAWLVTPTETIRVGR